MRVRSAREAKGWSQEHLAAASGVGLRTIQRVESGARVSHENRLALCAALGIEPEELPVGSSVTAGSLPTIARARAALDEAMAAAGERPSWQKSDASAALGTALERMGLSPDGDGFERAWTMLGKRYGGVQFGEMAIKLAATLWLACGMGVLLLALSPSVRWGAVLPAAGLWGMAGYGLWILGRRLGRAWERLSPSGDADICDAAVVLSDLGAFEAAVTQRFLWVARAAKGQPRVIRLRLEEVERVSVRYVADGYHSARFDVGTSFGVTDFEGGEFHLERLRDDEARWLEHRFPAACRVIPGRLQAA